MASASEWRAVATVGLAGRDEGVGRGLADAGRGAGHERGAAG